MQSTSCRMLDWMKHKLESGFLGEISITSDMQMTPPLWQKVKSLLTKVKEESEKADLKLNIQKMKIMASIPITSRHPFPSPHGIHSHPFMENRWGNMETVADFIFLGSKITADGDGSREIRRHLLLGRKVMTNLESI